MPSKNSLAALKAPKTGEEYKPVLPSVEQEPVVNEKPKKKQKIIGRPPKAKDEKRTYKITLSLTPKQGADIARKAGIAGEATYLYDQLIKAGIVKV